MNSNIGVNIPVVLSFALSSSFIVVLNVMLDASLSMSDESVAGAYCKKHHRDSTNNRDDNNNSGLIKVIFQYPHFVYVLLCLLSLCLLYLLSSSRWFLSICLGCVESRAKLFMFMFHEKGINWVYCKFYWSALTLSFACLSLFVTHCRCQMTNNLMLCEVKVCALKIVHVHPPFFFLRWIFRRSLLVGRWHHENWYFFILKVESNVLPV